MMTSAFLANVDVMILVVVLELLATVSLLICSCVLKGKFQSDIN